jgi:hypothetical protein
VSNAVHQWLERKDSNFTTWEYMLFNRCGRLSTKTENTTENNCAFSNAVVEKCAIFAITTKDENLLNGTYVGGPPKKNGFSF